jgi:dTDP-4-dehydrorhamnose 3,5-epimerase
MVIEETIIPGCCIIKPTIHEDHRGKFVKIFHYAAFKNHGLETSIYEEYYTTSHNRVLRGLHFQKPPHDHAKLVCCLFGKIFDVAVDLREASKTYCSYYCCELSANSSNMLYVPKGLAHGFYVLSDIAVVVYSVSTVYSPDHDDGILWDSVGIPWPDENPVLSERDKAFSKMTNFTTPFT